MLGVTHPLVTKASGWQEREGRNRHSFHVAGGRQPRLKGVLKATIHTQMYTIWVNPVSKG